MLNNLMKQRFLLFTFHFKPHTGPISSRYKWTEQRTPPGLRCLLATYRHLEILPETLGCTEIFEVVDTVDLVDKVAPPGCLRETLN